MIELIGKSIVFRINKSWYMFPLIGNGEAKSILYNQAEAGDVMFQGKVVDFIDERFVRLQLDGLPEGSIAEMLEECMEVIDILD